MCSSDLGRLVNPVAVEMLLMRHPDVTDVCCFPAEHPVLGLMLAAEVIIPPDKVFDEAALREFCMHHAEPHCVPRRISRVAGWTLNESGKRRMQPAPRLDLLHHGSQAEAQCRGMTLHGFQRQGES